MTQGPESLQDPHGNAIPTQNQIEGALARVVTDTETGRKTLDGYYFPPDNDDVFNPRVLTAGYADGSTRAYASTMTNSFARKHNLDCAALGMGPLFVREDDPEHIRVMEESKFRLLCKPSAFRQLIDRFFA